LENLLPTASLQTALYPHFVYNPYGTGVDLSPKTSLSDQMQLETYHMLKPDSQSESMLPAPMEDQRLEREKKLLW
jgi:hypothetical protein